MSTASLSPNPETEPFVIAPRTTEYVAGGGTSEFKAISIGVLEPHFRYTQGDMRKVVIALPGSDADLLGNRTNQMTYAESSFAPYELVEIDTTGHPKTVELTEEGEEYAKPLAFMLLDFANRRDRPLNGLFGQNNGGAEKGRSTSTSKRLELIQALLQKPAGLRINELKRMVDMSDQTIIMHLKILSGQDLVDYSPASTVSDTVGYKVIDFSQQPTGSRSDLSDAILAFFNVYPTATLDELYEHYRNNHIGDEYDDRRLKQQIAIRAANIAKAHPQFLQWDKFPRAEKIFLSEKHRELWSELLGLLNDFQNSTPEWRQNWREKGRAQLQDATFVRNSLERAKANSSLMQLGKISQFILSIIAEEEVSGPDLTQIISLGEGYTVNGSGVQVAADRLVKAGLVQARQGARKTTLYRKVA